MNVLEAGAEIIVRPEIKTNLLKSRLVLAE